MRVNFSRMVVVRRFYRQGKRCALCGRFMSMQRGDCIAHHMDGDNSNGDFTNVVVLCSKKCHLRAHCGNFAGRWVLPMRSFCLTAAGAVKNGGEIANIAE